MSEGAAHIQDVPVLIAGAGMAGITAAAWCRRFQIPALVVEADRRIGGQISSIQNEIMDLPPGVYANGEALIRDLEHFVTRTHLDVRLEERLCEVEPAQRLVRTDRAHYRVDFLILATGSRPKTLTSLDTTAKILPPDFSTTREASTLQGRKVLVVGGGDRAVESACNLSRYADHIWIALRGTTFRASDRWQARLAACPNVYVLRETRFLPRLAPDERGIRLLCGHEETWLPVQVILPRIGVEGNAVGVPFLQTGADGFLAVNEAQETSEEWIYAIGDLATGSAYASLVSAMAQGMRATKRISQRGGIREHGRFS